MKNFWMWLSESTGNIIIDFSNYENELKREINSHVGPYKYYSGEYSQQDADNYYYNIISQTKNNMNIIKSKIEEAIESLTNWSTTAIIIAPNLAKDHRNKIIAESSSSAYVQFGDKPSAPSFMISLNVENNEIHIDDILEGGDTDFFQDENIQNDYFGLIDALKNLGKPRRDKVIRLFTARPKKDRQQIQMSQTLPKNVFLTDNEEHAYGLAHDLSGGQEVRDVWMVKINSKYLTKTLDGQIKYYQLTTDDAPMEINLVS